MVKILRLVNILKAGEGFDGNGEGNGEHFEMVNNVNNGEQCKHLRAIVNILKAGEGFVAIQC